MITRIREVRRARGLTLDDVAKACEPPTTAQTIGRLETGTRTVSIGWLNRIAAALGVDAQDLVERSEAAELKVAAGECNSKLVRGERFVVGEVDGVAGHRREQRLEKQALQRAEP